MPDAITELLKVSTLEQLWVPIFRENKYPPSLSLLSLDFLLLGVKCILTNIGNTYRTGKKAILDLLLLRFPLPFL
mgnify:CR=1 FL=1